MFHFLRVFSRSTIWVLFLALGGLRRAAMAITSSAPEVAISEVVPQLLWNLSNVAVTSRQTLAGDGRISPYPYHLYQQYGPPKLPSNHNKYGLYYHQKKYGKPSKYRPSSSSNYNYHQYEQPPPPFASPAQSFMTALESISRYDDLQCVPRLLCEIVSGERSSAVSSQGGGLVPSFINMDSLLTLLRGFQGAQPSPLLLFGQAALLGFSSQGNSGSCMYAYPRCPRDPERLVKYLNNHNGGFFRYFGNGYQPQQYQQRIQTKPTVLVDKWRFPPERIAFGVNNRGLRFPTEDSYGTSGSSYGNEVVFYDDLRKPKQLGFPQEQRLYQTPMVFPDRTGTGELILDAHQLYGKRHPYTYPYKTITTSPYLSA